MNNHLNYILQLKKQNKITNKDLFDLLDMIEQSGNTKQSLEDFAIEWGYNGYYK